MPKCENLKILSQICRGSFYSVSFRPIRHPPRQNGVQGTNNDAGSQRRTLLALLRESKNERDE